MRTAWRRWLSITAAMLLGTVLLGTACASVSTGPVSVSPSQLAADEGTYDGRKITTQGMVRQFQDADGTVYYAIEDSRPNRVELEPATAARAYVGQQVNVIGTFHVDEQRGRSITIEGISR